MVVREALHSRNLGGGRSRRQSTADDLQGRIEIQRSRGLTREETLKIPTEEYSVILVGLLETFDGLGCEPFCPLPGSSNLLVLLLS